MAADVTYTQQSLLNSYGDKNGVDDFQDSVSPWCRSECAVKFRQLHRRCPPEPIDVWCVRHTLNAERMCRQVSGWLR